MPSGRKQRATAANTRANIAQFAAADKAASDADSDDGMHDAQSTASDDVAAAAGVVVPVQPEGRQLMQMLDRAADTMRLSVVPRAGITNVVSSHEMAHRHHELMAAANGILTHIQRAPNAAQIDQQIVHRGWQIIEYLSKRQEQGMQEMAVAILGAAQHRGVVAAHEKAREICSAHEQRVQQRLDSIAQIVDENERAVAQRELDMQQRFSVMLQALSQDRHADRQAARRYTDSMVDNLMSSLNSSAEALGDRIDSIQQRQMKWSQAEIERLRTEMKFAAIMSENDQRAQR